MKIKEFGYYVEEHIREFLPEDRRESAEVSVHPKKKVNDTLRYGLAIRFDSDKISPVLYLEDAWQAYENGADMKTVLGNLAWKYMELLEYHKDVTVDTSMEYGMIKDRVVYQICNKEANRNSLQERVYTDIGQGLVKVYAIHQELDGFETGGSIAITHDVMKRFGYDVEEIREDAEENTPWIYPAVFAPVGQMLEDAGQGETASNNTAEMELYVLTNTAVHWGAGALFYPGMQEKIAEQFGRNYYVLPSSLHEVMIVPEKPGIRDGKLEQIVQRINREKVSRENFLSNKVLFYDREKGRLRVALPDVSDLQLGDQKLER